MLRWLLPSLVIIFGLFYSKFLKELMPAPVKILPPTFEVPEEDSAQKQHKMLDKISELNKDRNSQWWIKYRRAQLWQKKKPDLACEKYTELSKDQAFPLNAVAWIRALEVCDEKSSLELQNKSIDFKYLSLWLRPTVLEAMIKKAERMNDREEVLKLTLVKSRESLPSEEKIKLTRKALDLAEELDQKEDIALLKKRLYQLAPRLDPSPDYKDWPALAKDFRRARKFDESRTYYNKIIKDKRFSSAAKRDAYLGLRLAWKNERMKMEHLKATEDYAYFTYKLHKKNKRSAEYTRYLHDAYIELMRTYWTLDLEKRAQATLDFLEKELKKKYSRAEVFWLKGRMDEERHEYKKAAEWFRKGLKEKEIREELTEKLLWGRAWTLRKINQHKEASKNFAALKRKATGEFSRTRYHYWLARSLNDSGREKHAKKEFLNLIADDPLGYYGFISHLQIGETIPLETSALLKVSPELPQPDPKTVRADRFMSLAIFEWLVSLNELELAQAYMSEVGRKYVASRGQTKEGWALIYNYCERAGDHVSFHKHFSSASPRLRYEMMNYAPRLLFPQPFLNEVTRIADKFGIKKELIYSIIRQESGFNPMARSHADAFGLMQMLPEIAKGKAQELDMKFHGPEDLYDPVTNITLGSAFVKELWNNYSGQFILAVASYNANDDAIKNWVKTRYKGDSITFIEDIPYDETRGYVRLVMRNFIAYNVLDSIGQRIEFPEWVMELDPKKIPQN